MKNKIKEYFKLKREIDKIEKLKSELSDKLDKIFLCKFIFNGIYFNASGILDVFLNDPYKEMTKIDVNFSVNLKWSKESMEGDINKIFNVFLKEKTIIKVGVCKYKLNPEYACTSKRYKLLKEKDENKN